MWGKWPAWRWSFLANIVLMCSEVNILWLLTLPTDGFHPVVLKQRPPPSRKTTCLLFCKRITGPNDKTIAIHYIIPLSSKAMKIVEVLKDSWRIICCVAVIFFFCFYGCWWILFVPLFHFQVDWVNWVKLVGRSKTVIKDQTIKDDDRDDVHLLNSDYWKCSDVCFHHCWKSFEVNISHGGHVVQGWTADETL